MLTHETAVKVPVPGGRFSDVQVVPPSVVPMTTGLPKMPNPTAVQSVVVGQEIPLRPLTWEGIDSLVHAYPAFREVSTESTPAAKQSAVLGHEVEFSVLLPAGGFWAVHDNPPVTVVMIVDPAPLLPLPPTAMQSSGAEHEMPVRSTAFDGTD